jgi:hypothetical protein
MEPQKSADLAFAKFRPLHSPGDLGLRVKDMVDAQWPVWVVVWE